MILRRALYKKPSFLRARWARWQLRHLTGEKLFRTFKLVRTELPGKTYFYSPRLKRPPRFSGNLQILAAWDASVLERMCPTNAIKVTPRDVLIDAKGCITCGLCVEIAPPGLLDMPHELVIQEKSETSIT